MKSFEIPLTSQVKGIQNCHGKVLTDNVEYGEPTHYNIICFEKMKSVVHCEITRKGEYTFISFLDMDYVPVYIISDHNVAKTGLVFIHNKLIKQQWL